MNKQEKQAVLSAWNEVEEAQTSLSHFEMEHIPEFEGTEKEMLDAIGNRLKVALGLLGEYFTDEEVLQHIGDPNYRILK